ncbi:MAG: hypothetical protein Q4E01_03850 [Actinomycetaceae bacterium]|nr:hypothetical protein [Actinomycetaceae bacterium]
MVNRPEILLISFSDIHKDARVLRQLSVVKEFGAVTTVGYGEKPTDATHHISIPADRPSLPQTPLGVLALGVRALDFAELRAPGAKYALAKLKGQHFDIVISNDARALPLAFAVNNGAPVWADLHEWAPEERTHVLSWRLLVAPLMKHVCKKYLPQVAEATTVGDQIAELYEQHFGVKPKLMRNTPRYAELEPSETAGDKIRMVHSGGAVYGRNLEATIDVAKSLQDNFSLDLYLIPANDGGKYLAELKDRAAGAPNVTFHDPVTPDQLPATLNQYDLGVFWIPPFNTNARLTLPNKLFDFIQARLALAVGPTIEMVNVLKQYENGIISDSFEHSDIVESLKNLTPEDIRRMKENSARAATDLNFEKESEVGRDILRRLLKIEQG